MDEVQIIEQRLFDQQAELLKQQSNGSPGDEDQYRDYPLIAVLRDGLVAYTSVLRQNLAAAIDKIAVAVTKIEKLEKRLVEVETRGFKYNGVYQKAQRYTRGDVVTYSGSAYVAIKDVVPEGEVPNASTGWALLVQRGRDAAGRDR